MDLFQISSIIIFFASLGFGFFVYNDNRSSRLNMAWFVFSASVGIWGLSLYGVTSSKIVEVATRWQYVLDISGIFIPIFYLYFVSTLLSLKNRVLIIWSLILATMLSVFSTSHLFKIGVVSGKFDFFWIEPGVYYFVFPLLFIGYILYSIFLLLRAYFKTHEPLLHSQIKYQIIASIIGFGGGVTNFLPQLFNIYPFGNYFILLYIFFISYSILKYKLFNVKTVATELFAGGVIILFLFNLLSSVTLEDWLIKFLLFILVVFFSVLMVRGVFKEIESREKIEALAKDLETANERLKELDRMKSEFVSIASHQLRSPLTAIKGYASMVMEGSFGEIGQKAKDAVGRIFESSNHLAAVVEDLLNVTKIEQGGMKYEFTKVDFKKLTQDIIDSLRPNIDKAGLKISYGDNGHKTYFIKADYEKIRQVVLNLVDNAVKYTKKGDINIFLNEDNQKGETVLSVADSGMGIPQELKDRLFEKFSRGNDISKINTGGSGLGLYVAREIVKAHGGEVWAESKGEGTGSTFYVKLPEFDKEKEVEKTSRFAEEL